jgi:alpha-ketoglutarate-dependent taurine dioxygenase
MSDGQMNYSLADIPIDIGIKSQESIDGEHHIRWSNDVPGFDDDHVSIYPARQVIRGKFGTMRPDHTILQRKQHLWDRNTFDIESSTIAFDEYMHSNTGLARALHLLWRYGLIFIKDVPSEENAVADLANRVALLRNTFYKPTWDVRSKPNAENVAYTSRTLNFHQDLLYMKEPPGLQFLHCIENTCQGGESAFADTFEAVWRLESKQPELVQQLATEIFIPYGYNKGGHSYFDKKPVLPRFKALPGRPGKKITTKGQQIPARMVSRSLTRVYWSPPFVVPDQIVPNRNPEQVVRRQTALKAFSQELEREDLRIETKLPPGTCAVFDNLRVVHARKSFDTNSGRRWLKGAYLDNQDFLSKACEVAVHMPPDPRRFSRPVRPVED